MLFIRSTAWRFRRRKVLRMAPSPQRRRARQRAQQHHFGRDPHHPKCTLPGQPWRLCEGNRLRRQRSFRRSWTCTGSWHSKCRETWTTHVIAFAFAFDFCRASSMSSFLPVRRLSPDSFFKYSFLQVFYAAMPRSLRVMRDTALPCQAGRTVTRTLQLHVLCRGNFPACL